MCFVCVQSTQNLVVMAVALPKLEYILHCATLMEFLLTVRVVLSALAFGRGLYVLHC